MKKGGPGAASGVALERTSFSAAISPVSNSRTEHTPLGGTKRLSFPLCKPRKSSQTFCGRFFDTHTLFEYLDQNPPRITERRY